MVESRPLRSVLKKRPVSTIVLPGTLHQVQRQPDEPIGWSIQGGDLVHGVYDIEPYKASAL